MVFDIRQILHPTERIEWFRAEVCGLPLPLAGVARQAAGTEALWRDDQKRESSLHSQGRAGRLLFISTIENEEDVSASNNVQRETFQGRERHVEAHLYRRRYFINRGGYVRIYNCIRIAYACVLLRCSGQDATQRASQCFIFRSVCHQRRSSPAARVSPIL